MLYGVFLCVVEWIQLILFSSFLFLKINYVKKEKEYFQKKNR